MTAVSEEMRRLMRESMSDLDALNDSKALVPIKDMWPNHMSFTADLPTNGLVYLFPVELDGRKLHVYLKQH